MDIIMKKARIAAAVLAALVGTTALLSGCGNGNGGTNTTADLDKLKKSSYPIDTDVKLTYWSQAYSSDADTNAWNTEYQKRLGVTFERMHPAAGQEVAQFNVMIASGELPDIVDWYWADYVGGPDKAITEGSIAKLNDLLPEYAPDFWNYLQENEFINKRSRTDEGNYYYFPGLVQYGGENEKLRVTAGYMFRKDYLDKMGLEVPETIDDWHHVLTTFKNNGIESPLCISANDVFRGLGGAFGVPSGWYQVDGKVMYGNIQPEFKECLSVLKQWYDEGLFDKNFINLDTKTVDAKLLGGEAGAVFGWLGSGMGKWLSAAKDSNPEFDLVGVPYPVKNRGDVTKFATKDAVVYSRGPAISAKSKHKELAVKVLNYGYTEEGHNFFNFGQEGLSYNMVDGYPTYSEMITNNPDGLTFDEALAAYTSATGKGAYVQDLRYIEQRYRLPQQKAAQEVWMKTEVDTYAMPPLTPTSEESQEFSAIVNDINTYVQEMYLKFITGKEPLDKFDAYVQQVKDYGLERATEIQQNALDRFNKR